MRPPRGRRRAVPRIAFVVLGLLLLAALGGGVAWRAWIRPTGGRPSGPPYQIVRVPAGASFDAVVDTLSRRGLARQSWLLRAVARATGQDRHLRAGVYTIPAGLPPRELLALLGQGRVVLARVLLPEGIESEEAARRVAAATGGDPTRFLATADSLARAGLIARGLLGAPPRAQRLAALAAEGVRAVGAEAPRGFRWCEGYLAPDTYFLPPGLSAAAAARIIVDAGLAQADSLARRAAPAAQALGLTPHDVVTLASIVEAEARLPGERRLIAAVYLNRLRLGWRLEADPTIAYALRKRGERLYYRDLEVASPYNTYTRAGLPPGPIGNPGAAALRAAARPDPVCDALFFVARGDGGHVFSRTREAHLTAVREYREQRAREARAAGPR